MTTTQLLQIQPPELRFLFELKKQSTCQVHMENKSDQYVAFKVKTTVPKNYCVRPNFGIIKPKETCDFTVTMQAQQTEPLDMQCKDKFLIQSTLVPFGTTKDDITSDMFAKDSGKSIQEKKLRVVLISPNKVHMEKDRVPSGVENIPAPLKVSEEYEQLKSRLSLMDTRLRAAEVTILKLDEERRMNTQEKDLLKKELEDMRRKVDMSRVLTKETSAFLSINSLSLHTDHTILFNSSSSISLLSGLHSTNSRAMTTTQLLQIQPPELRFLFELKKQSTCQIHMENKSDQYVAFKVKTTVPKNYCVRPNFGIIKPKETCDFTVTMQAQRTEPLDMQRKDKFLIQSTLVRFGTTKDDITSDMFAKDSGKYIEEKKLRVVLISLSSSLVLLPVNGDAKQESNKVHMEKDRVPSGVEKIPPPLKSRIWRKIKGMRMLLQDIMRMWISGCA